MTLNQSATDEQRPPSKPASAQAGILLLGVAAILLIFGWFSAHATDGHATSADAAKSHAPPMLAVGPFAMLLLCTAVLPLVHKAAHWWEHNHNKLLVSGLLAALTLGYYFVAHGAAKTVSVLDHAVLQEFIPFITLLLALYVISGGISLTGDLPAHPATNTAFLAAGTLLASFVGTTGASMLLIRPLLQTNAERQRKTHTVVFFIFLVSNIGGSLLPIGDPPLFLGFLKGVPFLWTLKLWPMWLMGSAILLAVYFAWDTVAYRKETPRDIALDETQHGPLKLSGKLNFVWLLGVVLCAALIEPGRALPILGYTALPYLREALMLGLAVLSLLVTAPSVRVVNQFNYTAILEVAALFIGIFICMQAPIEILKAGGESLSSLLNSPARFFWATGTLSSFLDNAPTYAIFLETASSMTAPGATGTIPLTGGAAVSEALLIAISLGAVFMGANTYIGNGPNFMVKSIAEQHGVAMPSFFGYMLYSVGILVPLFALMTWVFLR